MKPVFILIAGTANFIIVMGIGRFAYTPILPLMQQNFHFSESLAGYLASFNYFGYLIGALTASYFTWGRKRTVYLKIYLIVNIITTILMGVTTNYSFWAILRFISGISSGLVFVLTTAIILESLIVHKRQSWSGFLYVGVGIGIFLSGIIVPFFNYISNWEGAWIGLGFMSAIISIFTLLWIQENNFSNQPETNMPYSKSNKKNPLFKWLILSYGCEGLGYIITGTFIVTIIRDIPELKPYAFLSWSFVGIAAVLSCFVWTLVVTKIGYIKALYLAFLLQAFGIMLPTVMQNIPGVLLGALLFGGTFVGITTLVMSLSNELAFQHNHKVIGYLTASYGIGQIIGPIIASTLISYSNNYDIALFFASITIFFSIVLLFWGQLKYKKWLKN